MGLGHSQSIPLNGLVLYLDAANPKSYPGSGTIWYDLSGNGYHHNLVNGVTRTTANGVACMDVSSGTKYIQKASATYTFGAEHTMIAWVNVNSDAQVGDWRTLWRSQSFDHPILIQDGTNLIGYYDNNTETFNSYGSNLTHLDMENKWGMLTIAASGGVTKLYSNDGRLRGSVNFTTNGNTHDAIGAYVLGQSQQFGFISSAMIYNRELSQQEIRQIYNITKNRYISRPNIPSIYRNIIPITTNGLVIYLDGKNSDSYPGSGKMWYDLSGGGWNGTIIGNPTFTDGYFDITGDSTYITIPNDPLNHRTNDFTYSAWVNFDAVDGLDTIFENGSWTDTLLFRYENTTFRIFAEGAERGNLTWTASIGSWVNIVLKRESGTVSGFVNGVSIGTPFSMTTDINIAAKNLFLMRSQHNTNQWTNGKILSFAAYNRALSTDEITSNYNNARRLYGF